MEKTGMSDCKPTDTPMETNLKLLKAKESDLPVKQAEYRSVVGGLLYLAVRTRPDIAFVVAAVAKFTSHPTQEHWTAVKRILRYLKGSQDVGIMYASGNLTDIIGYCDADWAGDPEDRRSTSGYMFLLAGGPITWRSQKQKSVALSTAEAEYMALSSASQEVIWLRNLMLSCGQVLEKPTIIYEDNLPAIGLAKNPQFHGRAKHISIRYHFTREQVLEGTLELNYCKTDEMIADMLTKPLPKPKLSKLSQMSNLIPWRFE